MLLDQNPCQGCVGTDGECSCGHLGKIQFTRFSEANVKAHCFKRDHGLFQDSSDTMKGVKVL